MGRRPYRMKERARRLEETRLRITEALVDLHRTVGPARTTVTDVARRAGVRRMTVYNHFPTELEMIGACSSHWAAQNPPPDAERWARIEDPEARLMVALDEMYRYYRGAGDMLGKVLRDEPLVPPLAEIMGQVWWPMIDAMVSTLAAGRRLRGSRRTEVEAALRLAIDFWTWRTLTRSGLTDERAAEIAARMVEAAARRPISR